MQNVFKNARNRVALLLLNIIFWSPFLLLGTPYETWSSEVKGKNAAEMGKHASEKTQFFDEDSWSKACIYIIKKYQEEVTEYFNKEIKGKKISTETLKAVKQDIANLEELKKSVTTTMADLQEKKLGESVIQAIDGAEKAIQALK